MSRRSSSIPQFLPRLRVTCGRDIALGPGKVELLELVAETGSIARAAAKMEMSYMRAWTLIKTMNACFREPIVEAVRGGSERGGARLTETGQAAVETYRRMEQETISATAKSWSQLLKLLKPR
jgi:molybdate transport system regulatory protein